MIPPVLFFFRITSAIWGLWWFHRNLGLFFSSVKIAIGILTRVCMVSKKLLLTVLYAAIFRKAENKILPAIWQELGNISKIISGLLLQL